MNKDQLQQQKKNYIEDTGILFESFDLPRMAGRIIGFLLISTPSYQTAGEIQKATSGSKASISLMTRLLIQLDIIERRSITGKRGTCYGLKAGVHPELLHKRMDFLLSMHNLARRGMELIDKSNTEQIEKLRYMYDMGSFLHDEIKLLLDRWQDTSKNNYKIQ